MAAERRSPDPPRDDASLPSTTPHAGSSPDLAPDTMLGQFRIIGPIGRGGMGVVYEAEDTLLRRRVAIKLLPSTGGPDDPTPRKLRREAQAVARLNHPNVVAVHHIGEWAGGHFLVLEYMRGGSLQNRIRGGKPMPWREATKAIAHACRGLVAAHAAGLIHRDIKPANLMSDKAGHVKLADFGLVVGSDLTASSMAGELTADSGANLVAGTPHYMCPEQCRGEPADERSDIYSLGATYFALLTGRPPFVGDPMPVMFAHCSTPTPNPKTLTPEVPEACAAIVNRAMAKEPRDRYQTATEMLAALQAAITPRSPEESQETQLIASRPPRRRRSLWIALIVLIAAIGVLSLAVVAGIASLLWHEQTHSRTPPRTTRDAAPRVENSPTIRPNVPATPAPFGGKIPTEGLVLQLGGRVEAVAFSPDGRRFAAGVGERPAGGTAGVGVWDCATGTKETHLWPDKIIHCLVFTRDLEGLLRGSPEGCWIWHFNKSEEFEFFAWGQVRAIAVPNESMVSVGAFAGPEQGRIYQWAYPGGQTRATLGAKGGAPVQQIAFLPYDKSLVATYSDGGIRIWDPVQGTQLRSPTPQGRFPPLIACAPNRPVLAMALRNGALRFWNVRKWEWEGGETMTGQDIKTAAYSLDGKCIITAGDPDAILWDVDSRRQIHTFTGHGGPVLCAAISPDGKMLATGGADGTARLWDLRTIAK